MRMSDARHALRVVQKPLRLGSAGGPCPRKDPPGGFVVRLGNILDIGRLRNQECFPIVPSSGLGPARAGEKNKRDVYLSAVLCRTAAKASKVLPDRRGFSRDVGCRVPRTFRDAASQQKELA